MKRYLMMFASILAVSLVFLGIAVPLTAFADDTLPITIGTMGEEDAHAVTVNLAGEGEATIDVSVNGESQEVSSAQAKQGDVVKISVTPNEPQSVGVTSFNVVDSSEASVERKYSEERVDGTIYYSHVYTFTMPDSAVTASCVLGGVSKLSVYCALDWEDFDFTITNSVGDSMMPNEQKKVQTVPCRIYYLATGGYTFALHNIVTEKLFDSGTLNLNSGNFNLNWNKLTVTAEPAIVEGLGSFGTAGYACARENGAEMPPVSSVEEESGLCTVTFLLRGKGDDGSGSTNYSVSMTPKDERCSAVWASGEQGTSTTINITTNIKTKYTASLIWRASNVMNAQGQAITELNGYNPESYLDAQKAEVVRIVSEAVEAIKAADSEEAIAELLANAKQALDAIETASQVEENSAPVAQAIADLPAADALTLDKKGDVKNARDAYDALTDAEKAYVGEANLLKLELAEAVIEKLALAEQVSALEDEKKDLQDQVSSLEGDKEALQGKIDEAEGKLKAAEENLAKAEERATKGEEALAKATAAPAAKQANTMKVSAKAKTLKAKKLAKKAKTFKAVTVKDAKGKVTYKKVKVNNKKFAKKFAVNKKTGKITAKKGVKAGTYKVTVKVRAAGDSAYEAASENVVVKVTVK